MVSLSINSVERDKCNLVAQEMSSYLPLRHGATGRPGEHELHSTENSGYMDHFLNIPDICPTGADYRSSRYYMNSYQAEQCRMEALQQRNHDLRMGLQARPPFYPNMSVASNLTNLRFRDTMVDGLQMNNNKNEPMSPGCAPGLPPGDAEGPPPSFYPWMSIVGKSSKQNFSAYISHFMSLYLIKTSLKYMRKTTSSGFTGMEYFSNKCCVYLYYGIGSQVI